MGDKWSKNEAKWSGQFFWKFCLLLFIVLDLSCCFWALNTKAPCHCMFQCDKFNLKGILKADNSPLTCWTSSIAQRSSNLLSDQSGQWVCVFSLRCPYFLSILTTLRIKINLFTGNLLLLKPQSCQCNQWHLKETHRPIVFDHSHNLYFSIKSHWWNFACLMS